MNPLIQLELIRESLVAVVNEMRANIIHSSYAAIIYEGHDFSCALMSADGRQVAQGLADHPIHIFAVPYSTREVVKVFKDDIHEGDLFLHNDHYTGGTHLNIFFSGFDLENHLFNHFGENSGKKHLRKIIKKTMPKKTCFLAQRLPK